MAKMRENKEWLTLAPPKPFENKFVEKKMDSVEKDLSIPLKFKQKE